LIKHNIERYAEKFRKHFHYELSMKKIEREYKSKCSITAINIKYIIKEEKINLKQDHCDTRHPYVLTKIN
jgi:transposase